jgi:iron complex outermembrane receptor protein
MPNGQPSFFTARNRTAWSKTFLTGTVCLIALTAGGPHARAAMPGGDGGAAVAQAAQTPEQALEQAQSETRDFDIPAQPLADALILFGRQAGLQATADAPLVKGVLSRPVKGSMTWRQALATMLQGTGIIYRMNGAMVALEKPEASGNRITLGTVSVEGRGGQVSPAQDPQQGYKADFASTATRTSVPIQETPSSINVITDDLMRDTFSRFQGDALEGVSGVARGNRRLGRSEDIVMRGFRYQSGETVGAVKSNGLSGTSRFAPDPALVERYEVLKGPASIVGGASQPGGVINRITKRPTADDLAELRVEGGAFDLKRGVADLGGVLMGEGSVRGRMIMAAEGGGEYIDEVDARQLTISPSLEVDTFDGAGKLFLTSYYQRFDGSSYSGGPLLADGSIPGNAPDVNLGCLDRDTCGAFTDVAEKNAEFHYDHAFQGDLSVSVKGRYLKSNITSLNLTPFGNTNNSTTIWAGYSTQNAETMAAEASVKKAFKAFGRTHELVGGFDLLSTRQTFGTNWKSLGSQSIINPTTFYSASRADFGDLTNNKSDLEQQAVFAQAVLRPIDRVTVVLGGRHDWADISYITSTAHNGDDLAEWTMRAGTSVKVMEGMNVYAGYQESFVPNATDVDLSESLLPSETAQNYEVGAKFDLLDGRMSLTSALFRTYRQNVSTPDPDAPSGSSAKIATGEQRHQGVEFDLTGEVSPGLKLNANFSWADIEITKSNTAGEEGNAPFRTPLSYYGRIFATYQFQSGALEGFGFGGGVYFHSGYNLDALAGRKARPISGSTWLGSIAGWKTSISRSISGT